MDEQNSQPIPSPGEVALLRKVHTNASPPLTPAQLRNLRDLQKELEGCFDQGPRGTDSTVEKLRTLAGAASWVPGSGNLLALVINGLATGVDVAGGLKRGVSREQLTRDILGSAARMGLSVLPGDSLVEKAAVFTGDRVVNSLFPNRLRDSDRSPLELAGTLLKVAGVSLPNDNGDSSAKGANDPAGGKEAVPLLSRALPDSGLAGTLLKFVGDGEKVGPVCPVSRERYMALIPHPSPVLAATKSPQVPDMP